MRRFLTLLFLGAMLSGGAAELFHGSFEEGKWKKDDFLMVKSSRWDYAGKFIQEKDHIVNACPVDATPAEMLGKRAGETYTAMVLNRKFSGALTASATMSFDYRMAPSLVIAKNLTTDPKARKEFGEHFEIVLFDSGINVWHHWFDAKGKQVWRKAAFLNGTFKAGEKYTLTVKVAPTRRGCMLTLACDGRSFGYIEDAMPAEYYLGIIACEGKNRFYDFKIQK